MTQSRLSLGSTSDGAHPRPQAASSHHEGWSWSLGRVWRALTASRFGIATGAQTEAHAAHVQASLAGVPVSRAMITHVTTVRPDEPVTTAVQSMLAGFQDEIPVVDRGSLVGLVGRAEALHAMLDHDHELPVSSVMLHSVPSVQDTDSLDSALERLHESGRRAIPVVHDGSLVGMLPMRNVLYLLQARDRARFAPAHGEL